MLYDLAPCPFCACADVHLGAFNLRERVAVHCAACGARGPVRAIGDFMNQAAAGALAADDWNDVAQVFHEAREDEQTESAQTGLTEADKAEIDRIAASLKEPATEEPDQRVPAAGDLAPGSTTAECDTEKSADAPQVSEAAGGGGGEEANQGTPKAPTAHAWAGYESLEHPIIERVQAYLARNNLTVPNAGFSVSDANLYKILAGEVQPRMGTLALLADELAELERKERDFMAEIGVEEATTDDHQAAAKPNGDRAPDGSTRHPIAQRIEAYLERTEQSVWSGLFSVSDQTVHNILNGSKPKAPTVEKLARELDKLERDEVRANRPIDPSKVEVLPNRYDELNTGNPLPKHERPARCAGTP